MAQRTGTCGDCDTRYRIPDSFGGTKAKCKKCGGVVVIPPAAAAAAAPPAAEERPSRRAAKSSGARSRGSARPSRSRRGVATEPESEDAADEKPTRGGRARGRGSRRGGKAAEAAEAGRGAGRRGRRGSPASQKKNNTMLFASVAGVMVIGGALGLWMVMGGDDENDAQVATATAQPSGEEAARPVTKDDTADTATPQTTAPTPAPAEAAEPEAPAPAAAKPAPTPAEPEDEGEVVTLIEFTPLERAPDTSDEDWQAIQDAVEGMSYGGKARKRSMQKLVPYSLKAVPAVINSLNGTDLTDATAWRDAFEVAVFLQNDLFLKEIKIPFRGDYSQEAAEIRYAGKCVQSLMNFWQSKVEDPEAWSTFAQKVAKKKAEMDR